MGTALFSPPQINFSGFLRSLDLGPSRLRRGRNCSPTSGTHLIRASLARFHSRLGLGCIVFCPADFLCCPYLGFVYRTHCASASFSRFGRCRCFDRYGNFAPKQRRKFTFQSSDLVHQIGGLAKLWCCEICNVHAGIKPWSYLMESLNFAAAGSKAGVHDPGDFDALRDKGELGQFAHGGIGKSCGESAVGHVAVHFVRQNRCEAQKNFLFTLH